MYLAGTGVEKSEQKAFALFSEAADFAESEWLNDRSAMLYWRLGLCYRYGWGTETDPYMALSCLACPGFFPTFFSTSIFLRLFRDFENRQKSSNFSPFYMPLLRLFYRCAQKGPSPLHRSNGPKALTDFGKVDIIYFDMIQR
jgi:hypothetical protein